MMGIRSLRRWCYLLFACVLCACEEDMVHRFCAVDSQDWQKSYKARFHLEDLKLRGQYDLSVEARVAKQYLYKDLWLEVETKKNGEVQALDTVCLDVVAASGEMDGSGRNILGYKKPVRSLAIVPTDTLDICVRHILTVTPVPGVHDVGILLVPKR